jgi:SAM-dependent methyltransferase
MTKAELQALLERENFRYQRMTLPHGLTTRGEDRTGTAEAIFGGEDLSGRSVLDIGCCYGFFLYEAQKRGATRALGLEVNPDRLRQARLLREVYGSRVEFSDRDFLEVCREESFDYVLMLNVIHHLVDPIEAIRVAARCARVKLVLEFPTLMDRRFRKRTARLLPGLSYLMNRLPVIGVSSLPENGQTFLFSREALRRVLMDHDRLVESVEFHSSPKRQRDRLLAICRARSGAGPA